MNPTDVPDALPESLTEFLNKGTFDYNPMTDLAEFMESQGYVPGEGAILSPEEDENTTNDEEYRGVVEHDDENEYTGVRDEHEEGEEIHK